ncbi:MAG TPA: hypothetical protein VFZ98_06485 [Vicinamibacterales bacterium]
MISRESALRNQMDPSSSQHIIPRRAMLAGMSGAVAAFLASPRRVMAEDADRPNDPFIVLLHGIYQPVVTGPDLGLSSVNLSDGTYSRTRIYPVYGIKGDEGSGDASKPIGTFYVQFGGNLCAYDLPGGAIAMRFDAPPPGAPPGFNGFVPFPDGQGGLFLEGTFELDIIEATGLYQAFKGGHNHMVDRLHKLADGRFNEFCFCNISTYPFP